MGQEWRELYALFMITSSPVVQEKRLTKSSLTGNSFVNLFIHAGRFSQIARKKALTTIITAGILKIRT
jgi:hypothetical protein